MENWNGVCEHCKRATSLNKTCRRCEFIVSEFKSTHEKTSKERKRRFKEWLCELNHVLQAILDGESECKHRLFKDLELERILDALKEPLNIRELDIHSFSNLGQDKLISLPNVPKSKDALEEVFSKMEFARKKCILSSDSPISLKQVCLCKYLKKKSDLPSKNFEVSVLPWEPLKDFSRTLRQAGHENLMKRLIHLSKDLPQELLNGELLKYIVEAINTALIQGLPQNIVKQLINKLTELNKTLTDDLSENLNTNVTQALINDLNELLLLGSSEDLNRDLITFLVGLTNLLTNNEIGKGLSKGEKRGKNKIAQKLSVDCSNAVVQKLANLNKALTAKVLDNKILQELSSDMHKAIDGMPPNELNELIKELTNSYELAKLGKSNTGNLEIIKGLISDSKKALSKGQTKDKNKKLVHVSVSNLNKQLTSDQKEVQKKSAKFTKNISKDMSKVLRSKYSTAKTMIKADHKKNLNKRLTGSEATIAKKENKNATKNTFATTDKKWKKMGQDRTDKRVVKQDLSQQKDGKKMGRDRTDKRVMQQDLSQKKDGHDVESSKNKVKKLIGLKGKENLTPIRYLKSQSRHKSKEINTEARKLSELLLSKLLAKEEKFKVKKYGQLAKQAEKEARKSKQTTMNDLTKQNKIMQTLSSRTDIVSGQRTEITIFGEPPPQMDIKKLKKQGDDPEPLPTSPAARRTSYQEIFKDGTIKYELSNEEFIRIGWTVVPKEKIMRKMNIYKMEPANSQNCWFNRHKEHKELFYDSGQKLADIDENGRGQLYYRNGNIALDYYNAEESNIGQRYVVYSSGTEIHDGKIRPRTVLALFDVLGNCIVYDLRGNVRLKYNQSEGVLVDPKIGPPGKWKWHTLNDPPDLQRLLVDTCLQERDPKLDQLTENPIHIESEAARQTNSEMVAIELDNFVKQKTLKLKQKFRPFKIRVKFVKLNEQFTLNIIDQANIYLLYRDGITNLKLNLGMLLKSNEIIDTVLSDVGDVPTPYDIHPAKTESVDNIQKILKSVRCFKQ